MNVLCRTHSTFSSQLFVLTFFTKLRIYQATKSGLVKTWVLLKNPTHVGFIVFFLGGGLLNFH